jgi:hypothetical protein
MAQADRRTVKTFVIVTNLVAFICGAALAIVALFAGLVTPPI